MSKKFIYFSIASALFLFLALWSSSSSFQNFNYSNYKDILANVANIDMGSIKAWQLNFGFRNDLARNDNSNEVKILQKALSTDPDIYPEKISSGNFGPGTEKAVKAFQAENNLPETGVVDGDTKAKINDIFYQELCPTPLVEFPDLIDFNVSKENGLPDGFIPNNLKKLSEFGVKSSGGIICLREDAILALKAMFDAAKKEGLTLAVSSGFRSPVFQKWLLDNYIRTYGRKEVMGIAEPGHSEHQIGTAVDLTGSSINYKSVDQNFTNSPESAWLILHAKEYGFHLSYGEGNTEYIFEPWHYRFFGLQAEDKD